MSIAADSSWEEQCAEFSTWIQGMKGIPRTYTMMEFLYGDNDSIIEVRLFDENGVQLYMQGIRWALVDEVTGCGLWAVAREFHRICGGKVRGHDLHRILRDLNTQKSRELRSSSRLFLFGFTRASTWRRWGCP